MAYFQEQSPSRARLMHLHLPVMLWMTGQNLEPPYINFSNRYHHINYDRGIPTTHALSYDRWKTSGLTLVTEFGRDMYTIQ